MGDQEPPKTTETGFKSNLSTWERAKNIGRPIKNLIRNGLVIVGFATVASTAISYFVAKRKSQEQLEALKDNPNKKIILELPLDSLIESKSDSERFLADAFGISTRVSIYDIQRALEHAKTDSRVVGLVATMNSGTPIGLASIQELDSILKNFKSSGKPSWVHAYFISTSKNMAAASSFDKIAMLPGGIIAMPPLATTQLFFRKLLNEKLGVKMVFEKRSEYKNAPNPVSEDDFTPAHREAMHALLSSMNHQLVKQIAANRSSDVDAVHKLEQQGFFVETDALQAGLVDAICHRNQIEYNFETDSLQITPITSPSLPSTTFKGLPTPPNFLTTLLRRGSPPTPVDPEKQECYTISVDSYLRGHKKKVVNPDIAVVFADGTIHKGRQGEKISGEEGITEEGMAKTFNQINQTPSIKIVVLRISSPGGDANASEAIWGHIRKTQATGRKVIVSMGEAAASGGYYMAAPADLIFAQPGTITGSIGVFFGKSNIRGLMEKLDVNVSSLSSTDAEHKKSTKDEEDSMAEYGLSGFHDWKGHNKLAIEKILDHNYNLFKLRVAEGRKMKFEDVEAVARGRVWSGEEAKKNGLVDELGGLNDAINAARTLIDKPDATVTAVNTATFRTVARSMMSRSASLGEALAELSLAYQLVKDAQKGEAKIEARGPTFDI